MTGTVTRSEVDWASVWSRGLTVLDAPAPVTLPRTFEVLVAACAPFRAGTRFRAVPDVRFHVDRGRLRAPGDLLPDTTDASMTGYAHRLDTRLGGEAYLLTVEQPFVLDFELWAGVRAAVEPLWHAVGWPSLPVVTELLVGDRYTDHTGPTDFASHAELTWVLHGRLRTGARTVGPNELLYRPPGDQHTTEYGERCVVLRLRIATDAALVGPALRGVLADLVQRERGPDVTYVDPSGDPRAELADLTSTVRRIAESPDLVRTLRRRSLVRRSAAGLEPAPPPRFPMAIERGQSIRVTGEIVRMPDGPGRELWAVHGHAFPLGGEAGERLFQLLRPGAECTIDDLCAASGAPPDEVGALVRILYRLHAVEPEGTVR